MKNLVIVAALTISGVIVWFGTEKRFIYCTSEGEQKVIEKNLGGDLSVMNQYSTVPENPFDIDLKGKTKTVVIGEDMSRYKLCANVSLFVNQPEARIYVILVLLFGAAAFYIRKPKT